MDEGERPLLHCFTFWRFPPLWKPVQNPHRSPPTARALRKTLKSTHAETGSVACPREPLILQKLVQLAQLLPELRLIAVRAMVPARVPTRVPPPHEPQQNHRGEFGPRISAGFNPDVEAARV